ncbi:MAG TPA: Ig-like domain-containing protein, partial [Gemmatimonadales bacterium]|nr:Ig-like domain-containing protein [Gemmatimonadales bacterium]
VAARTISPAVQVAARDAQGNLVTGFTGSVTVALGTNPSGGTLAGTTTVTAVSGVATFGNLSVDKVGTGYTLAAAATGLAGATSGPFNVTVGAATQFVFTVQPTSTAAGAAITPAVQVTALDAGGNVATGFAGSVAVALGTNPSGGTLSGTTTVTAVSGVASFASLSINKVGTGYTLTGAAPFQPALTGATSAPFDITPGAATRLVFTTQPSNATAGATLTPPLQVIAQDASGNTVPSFTGNVTVAITAGTGASGATLAGTTTVAAVSGVASFASLGIDKSGTGYTLAATAAGLTGAASAAFTITPGLAAQLAFTGQPGTATAGNPISPAVQVTAQDALGNAVAGFTGNVTVALGANPGGGTLVGTTTVAATNGVASFATLSIDKAETGYTLTAATAGLSGATSTAFNVVAGTISATQSTVVAAPPVITAGNGTATTTVTARDAAGNPVSGATVVLTATGTGNTLTQPAATDANGVATGSLSSTVAGSKTVTASIAGVTATQTAVVTVTAGAATQLAVTVQPTNTAAGATLTPAVQVTARDAQGNVATDFTGTVTVALGVNPGGATLSGTTSVAAVSGVATFSTLSIDKVGTGYTLTAAAPGLSGATSTAFNVTPGSATQLVFTVQPSNA